MHIDIPKRFKNAQVPEANTEGLIRHNRCVSYATLLREVPQSVISCQSVFFFNFLEYPGAFVRAYHHHR